jgi:23S rRNA (adenine2503-C2)-methyltransferase
MTRARLPLAPSSGKATPAVNADDPSPRAKAWHPVGRLPEQWKEPLQALGEPSFRADQIFRWIHQHGVFDVAQMTNLSQALRARAPELGISTPLSEERVLRSSDGTRKLLLRLSDGLAIESVMIPRHSDEDDEGDDEGEDSSGALESRPVTLCISTQVGCAMGCVFCASGQAGLKRGLGAHEVVAQLIAARRHLDEGERISNVVFMGMGEPLHHYAETAQAIRLITHPLGAGMSPRRITVSSVGLINGIKKLGADFSGKVGLAISLHAPDSETRSRIIPMNESQPLDELMAALRAYPLPKRRRITIEYTLIGGVNDQIDHARKLAQTLRGLRSKVNLIPMNPIRASDLRAPSPEGVEAFRQTLAELRVSCSVRQTRGDDVDAACGQLALT